MKVHLRKGLRIDDLGDEALVLDQSGGQVHRVDGDAVAVLRLLAGSGPRDGVEVPDALRAAVDELVDAGLVTTPTEFTRRKAIATGGAVWAAATVTTFALADPAAASTSCGMGISPTSSPQTYSTVGSAGMFTTGPVVIRRSAGSQRGDGGNSTIWGRRGRCRWHRRNGWHGPQWWNGWHGRGSRNLPRWWRWRRWRRHYSSGHDWRERRRGRQFRRHREGHRGTRWHGEWWQRRPRWQGRPLLERRAGRRVGNRWRRWRRRPSGLGPHWRYGRRWTGVGRGLDRYWPLLVAAAGPTVRP